MPTFPSRTPLADPTATAVIPDSDFAYMRTRNRLAAFNVVKEEFDRSGITQRQLAERMNMDAGRLSKLLGAPGNWTLDTVAELLWAISGARTTYKPLDYPLKKNRRNDTKPSFSNQFNFQKNVTSGNGKTIITLPESAI